MLKIGVVGGGYMGTTHSDAINKNANASLVGIVDIDRERGETLAKERGCAYFSCIDDLLALDGLDVVHICTPTHTHCEFIIKAANAKKHVLCEKPFALEDDEIAEAITAVEENNVKFMVAQVVRFWPENTVIKDYIDSGRLGEIKMVSAQRVLTPPVWADWYFDTKISGGGVFDLHTHDIDNMVDLFGKCTKVYAIGSKYRDGWNYITTSMTFASGIKTMVESSYCAPGDYPFTTGFRVIGSKACIEQSMKANATAKLYARGADDFRLLTLYEEGKERVAVPFPEYDAYHMEIGHFIQCVQNDLPPRVDYNESRNVMRVIRAIHASLETGQVVCTGWQD
ncbi:MAG: Gfo/Idh/MocA family oxidoreductase [Eubacteriales bacterium]|nr:Gfo/Idh/MocA family oxidoreductase [Eubacteriales bacterium]